MGGDTVKALAQATATGGIIFWYGVLSGEPTPFPLAAFGPRIAIYGYTFNEVRGTPEWDRMITYIHDHLSDGSTRRSRPAGISKAMPRSERR